VRLIFDVFDDHEANLQCSASAGKHASARWYRQSAKCCQVNFVEGKFHLVETDPVTVRNIVVLLITIIYQV